MDNVAFKESSICKLVCLFNFSCLLSLSIYTTQEGGILFVARVARIQPIAEASYRMTSGPRIPARLRVQSFSARPTSMFQVSTAFFFFFILFHHQPQHASACILQDGRIFRFLCIIVSIRVEKKFIAHKKIIQINFCIEPLVS